MLTKYIARCNCICQDKENLTIVKDYPVLKWDKTHQRKLTIINDKGIRQQYDSICFSITKTKLEKFISTWKE